MSRLLRLDDEQWRRMEPLLPQQSKTGGRPAKPHRLMVEAMIWVLRTGAPWRDLPPAYGPWQSVSTRFSRWSKSGVLNEYEDVHEIRARRRVRVRARSPGLPGL